MKIGRAFTVTDAALVSCSVAETETLWSAASTYALAAAVYVVIDGVHQRFVSAQPANHSNPPETDDGTWWTAEGPTNRWRQFDQRVQMQTSAADQIITEVQISGRVDAVFASNLSGQEMRVIATDATDGVVYDRTASLVSTSRITDWARYFREPIRLLKDKLFDDLPSGYSDLLIETQVNDPGETVLCGELVYALLADIGGTQWGGGIGRKSYTRIEDDEFGSDQVVPRGSKRTGDYGVIVDNRDLDDVANLLDGADGLAVLYVASSGYVATVTFGLLLDWKVQLEWPTRTALTLNIQSFVR